MSRGRDAIALDLRDAACAAFVVYANDVGDGWAERCVLPGTMRDAVFCARPLTAEPDSADVCELLGGVYQAIPVDERTERAGYAQCYVRARHLWSGLRMNAVASGLVDGYAVYGEAVFVRAK